jgi:hypothetical protein
MQMAGTLPGHDEIGKQPCGPNGPGPTKFPKLVFDRDGPPA